MERILAAAIQGAPGRAWQLHYRFRHRSGSYRWLEDQFLVMRDEAGRPQALIGSVSDVTERREAENALRRREEQLRNILEQMQDAHFRADREGRFVLVSESARRKDGSGFWVSMNVQ